MRSLLSLLPIAASLFIARLSNAAVVPLQRRNDWGVPGEGGCWTDNVGGIRALDKALGGTDDMTPAKCQGLCLAQGFALAGLEFGRECFCGNTIIGNNRPDTTICNTPCSGDSSQTCGGTDALTLFVQNGYAFTTGPQVALDTYNGFGNPKCYHDSASSRILTGRPSPETSSDQMTVQKCIDGCAHAGYSSAGLEFGRECYCGNSSNPLADSAELGECNMPCLGDASRYCGGANRLLLYHNPSNDAPQPTPEGSWAPVQGGCWTDSPSDRALERFIGGYDDLTPGKCQSLCEQAGFNLAGTEYARECYCGNTIMGNNHPSSGICTSPCTGSTDGTTCGGAGAITIYVKDNFQYTVGPASVLQSYNGYTVTQCWQDEASNRILKQSPATPIDFDEMTVQKCIDGCAAAGFSSAGVEYGGECHCDTVTFPPGQSTDMSQCNMACNGDGTEFCGGANAIIIYNKPSTPATITYNGVIEIHDANTNGFLGYVTKDTQNGISKYSGDLNNAEHFTFSAPQGTTTVTQTEIAAVDGIDGYPYFGLIEGYANSDSYLGPGNWQYLFVGGTSHSAPGAVPQDGPNSYGISVRQWESSVWTINTATGDITPQWVNPDNSLPTTYLLGWYGFILFGSGDGAQTNAHFGHSDGTVKLKFNANPV